MSWQRVHNFCQKAVQSEIKCRKTFEMMVENPFKIQLLDNVMACFWHPYMASSNNTRFNNLMLQKLA